MDDRERHGSLTVVSSCIRGEQESPMRQTLAVGGLIVLGFLALGGLSPAQQKLGPTAAAGRYQVQRINDNAIVVIDSATGHCWRRGTDVVKIWEDLGSPVNR
jgi:hypothetical protein